MDSFGGDLFAPGRAPHQAASHLSHKVTSSAAEAITVDAIISVSSTALLGKTGVAEVSGKQTSPEIAAPMSSSLKGAATSADNPSFEALLTQSSQDMGGLQVVSAVPSGPVVIGPSVGSAGAASGAGAGASTAVTIDVDRPSAGSAPRTVAKTVHRIDLNELKTTIASDVDGRVVDKTPSFALSDKQASSVQARFFARLEKEMVREAMKRREGIDLDKPKVREITINDRFKPKVWSNTIIDHYMANLARIIFLIMSMLERVLEKIFGKSARNPFSERIRRLLAMGQQEKARQEAERLEKERIKELKKVMMQAKLVARK